MFNSENFKTAWQEWKQYMKEKTFQSYTDTSERKALSSLFKRAHGIELLAIESIDYSIERNWNSIYIKPTENGNASNNGGSQSDSSKQRGTSTDRMEAARNW